MGGLVNSIVKIGTLGLVDDVTGQEAAGRAGQQAANVQAQAAMAGVEEARLQREFEREQIEIDRAQNTQRYNQQFDLSQERFDLNRADNAPRIEAGNQALTQQQALLGLSGQDAQQAAYGGIEESAGQRFLRERQQRALVRNSSAIGQNAANVSGQLGSQPTSNSASNVQTNIPGGSTNSIINAQSNMGAAQASGILAPTQANTAATNQILQLAGAGASYATGM